MRMWCILAKIEWGQLRTVRCPEERATTLCAMYGWTVLIRDSEFPVAPSHWPPYQTKPARNADYKGDDGA